MVFMGLRLKDNCNTNNSSEVNDLIYNTVHPISSTINVLTVMIIIYAKKI